MNVPWAAAGVGVGVAPGGVGIGVGVGVGAGFALTPPHPARARVNNRARASSLPAETKFFIGSPPGEGRLLLITNPAEAGRVGYSRVNFHTSLSATQNTPGVLRQ